MVWDGGGGEGGCAKRTREEEDDEEEEGMFVGFLIPKEGRGGLFFVVDDLHFGDGGGRGRGRGAAAVVGGLLSMVLGKMSRIAKMWFRRNVGAGRRFEIVVFVIVGGGGGG